jgi:salicylate hydroxylase
MLNQVAVFESPRALRGEKDWGTPDELDDAFKGLDSFITDGLPSLWRDRWWRMFDRDPIDNWIYGRVALLGDAAHPPLQYIAQGAIMAIEDGWVLAQHVARHRTNNGRGGGVDWASVLDAYNCVRPPHCRRVLTTSRQWGALWHLDGVQRLRRNQFLCARDTYDYSFIDWLYGATALTPQDEPEMFTPMTLSGS